MREMVETSRFMTHAAACEVRDPNPILKYAGPDVFAGNA